MFCALSCLEVPESGRIHGLYVAYEVMLVLIRRAGSLLGLGGPSFHMVSALARIGHKYEMTSLVQAAAAFLKSYYTADLDQWSKRSSPRVPPSFEDAHVIGVVNIARLINEPSVLLSALIACCTLDHVAKGLIREDGTLERLSYEDLDRCWRGRKWLTGWMLVMDDDMRRAVERNASLCTEHACTQQQSRILEKANRYVHHTNDDPFVLYHIPSVRPASICTDCWSHLQKAEARGRRIGWKKAPMAFGVNVPGWSMPLVVV